GPASLGRRQPRVHSRLQHMRPRSRRPALPIVKSPSPHPTRKSTRRSLPKWYRHHARVAFVAAAVSGVISVACSSPRTVPTGWAGSEDAAEGACQRSARSLVPYLSLVLTICTRRFSPAKGLSEIFNLVAPYPTATRRLISIPYFSDRKR